MHMKPRFRVLQLKVMVSPAEMVELERVAAVEGVSKSEWVRNRIREVRLREEGVLREIRVKR